MSLYVPKPGEPPPAAGSATGNPRNKVALKPGRSLMDWIRLGNSGQDLTGVKGQRLQVTMDELNKHNKETDAWMAVRGKLSLTLHWSHVVASLVGLFSVCLICFLFHFVVTTFLRHLGSDRLIILIFLNLI